MGKLLYRNNNQVVAETFVDDIGKYNDSIFEVMKDDFKSKSTLRTSITHVEKISDRKNVLFVYSIDEVKDGIRRRESNANRFNNLFSSE